SPLAGEVLEGDRPLSGKRCRPGKDVVLLCSRTLGHRIRYALAGIDDQVLELGSDPGCHVREAVSGHAAAGRTDASEVVLARIDIAALAVAAAEGEIVGL